MQAVKDVSKFYSSTLSSIRAVHLHLNCAHIYRCNNDIVLSSILADAHYIACRYFHIHHVWCLFSLKSRYIDFHCVLLSLMVDILPSLQLLSIVKITVMFYLSFAWTSYQIRSWMRPERRSQNFHKKPVPLQYTGPLGLCQISPLIEWMRWASSRWPPT